MNKVICPICSSSSFGKFAGRTYAKCLTCGSLERTRAVYMALIKFEIPRIGDQILHIAPEKGLLDKFLSSHSKTYKPVDLFPEKYKYPQGTIQYLDICKDLYSMPSRSWDLILHNHVLEHLFCSVNGVLRGFERILKPGGIMLFTIPIHKKYTTTIEDLNPDLSETERKNRFGDKTHVRLFGNDTIDLIEESLGENCFFPVTSLFTQNECKRAGIPWKPHNEPNGHSIFFYRKPEKGNETSELAQIEEKLKNVQIQLQKHKKKLQSINS